MMSPAISWAMASAIWLRHALCVQTNATRGFVAGLPFMALLISVALLWQFKILLDMPFGAPMIHIKIF